MNFKRTFSLTLLFVISIGIFLFSIPACTNRSELGPVAFKTFKNKAVKAVEEEAVAENLKKLIEAQAKKSGKPIPVRAFYTRYNYTPVILSKILAEKQLTQIIERLAGAGAHGLPPDLFRAGQIRALYDRLCDKHQVKNADEAAKQLAQMEWLLANALTDYSNALQFGAISPRKVYAQYYTTTKRPDKNSIIKTLETADIKKFLDSIQPDDKSYLALQQALSNENQRKDPAREEIRRTLMVNLERLRWKNKPQEDKYVWVNIPDFTLAVIENGKTILQMNVCVGEGRKQKENEQLMEYDEEGLKKDRPFNRETPQLNSLIYNVQVNPVWNIPQSIASNEIVKYAAADPYYLANNNIDVFLNGQRIEDPETINWTEEGAGKKYHFKQRPGAENSLGKIKFLFKNQSSVYLHDTPAKKEFNKPVRAVSHGCVRVEKPLELAKALFGSDNRYETIRKAMEEGKPRAKDIELPRKMPVYLSYYTCWVDPNGKLQYRDDIYGLDVVLYSHLVRLI